MERHITLPLTREEARTIKSGEQLLLSGVIYTARMRRINGFANLLKRANRCPLMLKTQRFITSAPLPQSPDRS